MSQEVYAEVLDRADRIDLALLSLGDLSPHSLLVRHGLPPDVSIEDLRAAGAVGDVLGQFSTSPAGNQSRDQFARDRIADREAHSGADRDVHRGRHNKVPVIAAALLGRIGKVLITDEKAAAGALKLIGKRR